MASWHEDIKSVELPTIRAEANALIKPIPHEGPALYSHPSVYEGDVGDRLALVKANRIVRDEAEKIAEEPGPDYFEEHDEKEDNILTRRGRTIAGLAVVASAATLILSNGGPKQVLEGIKTFPQHVEYVYKHFRGEDRNYPHYSFTSTKG